MKFATVSTLRATSQPALVMDGKVHTLPYPDMHAVIAGREAYLAGRMPKRRYASASSPLSGLI